MALSNIQSILTLRALIIIFGVDVVLEPEARLFSFMFWGAEVYFRHSQVFNNGGNYTMKCGTALLLSHLGIGRKQLLQFLSCRYSELLPPLHMTYSPTKLIMEELIVLKNVQLWLKEVDKCCLTSIKKTTVLLTQPFTYTYVCSS